MPDAPLWTPSPDRIQRANLTRFGNGAPYEEMYEWSIAKPEEFWRAMWDFGGVIGDRGERVASDLDRMPGATFFPDARINFAENALRQDGDAPAILWCDETGTVRAMSWRTLREDVAACAA